jgi:outer membrane lipopolysaccharide assembly protein LptE/RlpB
MRRLLALACLVPLLAGCGYRLAGQSSFIPERITSIGVPPFENETTRAELEQRISESVLDELLRRGKGRFSITAGRENVDAVLEGVVTGYSKSPVSFGSTGRATRQEVTITARLALIETDPETILWSQENFVFRRQYDIQEGGQEQFFDREIVAIEELARDFATAAVTSLLEGF